MSLRAAALALVALLAACTADAAPETVSATLSTAPDPDPEVAMFVEVLAQHRALNARVERVGYRLLTANAHLCEMPTRSTGMSVHTVSDYPDNLQPLARELLGVGDGVFIRSVVAGSPAEEAGVQAGDRVTGLGGMPIGDGVTAMRYWDMAQSRTLDRASLRLDLLRAGEAVSLDLQSRPACDFHPTVEFSPYPNAYTDGEELVVTSELVRLSDTDARLALILAHELAHSIAHEGVFKGDLGQGQKLEQGHRLEFDADAKGLVMIANAGFDMERAIDGMEAFAKSYRMVETGSHPAHARRIAALRSLASDLDAREGERFDLADGVSPQDETPN